MFFWTIAALIALGLIAYFWNQIREFVLTTICPRLEPKHGEMVRDFILMLDKPMTAIRRAVKEGWKHFKEKVLHCQTTYTKVTSSTATKTTEAIVSSNGQYKKITTEETVAWEDLPASVRHEQIKTGERTSRVDDREVIGQKVAEVTA